LATTDFFNHMGWAISGFWKQVLHFLQTGGASTH
jgi:hypothetical protein